MPQTETKPKKRGFGRVLLRILGVLLVLVLLLALAGFVIPLTETIPDADRTAAGSADWMADLPGSLPLNAITLPGTHDSATQYVQLAFFSKCQALSIHEQLQAGFRYLDIRLGADGERLKLMHGFTSCKTGPMPWSDDLYLEDVLTGCYAFLAAHPTETVVFAVKQEHGDKTAADFAALVQTYIDQRPEFWYVGKTIPTLDEVRGKLVLMRRYSDETLRADADGAGIPFLWANQSGHADTSLHTVPDDNRSYMLWIQDRYEYGTDDKWTAFTAGLEAAGTGPNDLAVHFLSTKGTLAYGHPYAHAKTLNALLLDLPSDKLNGWIILDFASAPLARHILAANVNAGR